jgi:hypothetical protein
MRTKLSVGQIWVETDGPDKGVEWLVLELLPQKTVRLRRLSQPFELVRTHRKNVQKVCQFKRWSASVALR